MTEHTLVERAQEKLLQRLHREEAARRGTAGSPRGKGKARATMKKKGGKMAR